MLLPPIALIFLCGCASFGAHPKNITEQHLDVQLKALQASVDSSVKSVTNEVWPYIIIQMVLAAILLLALYLAFRLVRCWIIEHSYLKQKPQWESMNHD